MEEPRVKSLIALTIATILVLAGVLLQRLGAFKPVELKTEEAGPFKIVYRHHTGAYHKIVPEIEAVEKWANAAGEPCKTSFGEYLDDPDKVDEDRLNSNGGCVVGADWAGKLPAELSYREIPRRLYVIADFDGAPSIGPQKVYPKAEKYLAENGLKIDGPIVEMYERTGENQIRTHYYFPATPLKAGP